MSEVRLQKHKQANEYLQQQTNEILNNIEMHNDFPKLICAIMFWCEGEKTTSSGVKFINSDPLMIQKFLQLLRSGFAIDESKLHALIHLHDYHDTDLQLEFWSKLTKIPKTQFYKPYIKPHTGKNQREGYPGCISIRYSDAKLGKLLKMIYSEFGNAI